jgi:hypothetical protein
MRISPSVPYALSVLAAAASGMTAAQNAPLPD